MSIYDYIVKNRKGEDVSLKEYEGKILLIVNSATGCGFTPQYEGLENLYKKYNNKGFEILDFPCDQFGHQAPGTDEEIHSFCTAKYNISFTQFKKIEVNGENEEPLYTFLKDQMPNEEIKGIKSKIAMKAISKISSTTKKENPLIVTIITAEDFFLRSFHHTVQVGRIHTNPNISIKTVLMLCSQHGVHFCIRFVVRT